MNHIFPTIVAVLAIATVFIGLPVLILWLMDKGGFLGTVFRKIFGLLTLIIGLTLIGWIIYNMFAPTEEFRAAYKTSLQLVLPGLLVLFGWRWLTGQKHIPHADIQDNPPPGPINTDE